MAMSYNSMTKITLKCFPIFKGQKASCQEPHRLLFKISQYLDTLIPYLIVNTRSKFFKTNTSQVILHKFTFHKNNFFIPEVQGTSKQAIVFLPKGL